MRRTCFALLFVISACGSRIDLSPSAVDWYADARADAAPHDAAPEAAPAGDADADADAGDNRILPLQLGRKWLFTVDVAGDAGGAPTCTPGTHQAFVVGESTVQDQPAIRYQPLCDPFPVDVVGSGDQLTAFSTDGSNVSWLWMDTPVADGHTWEVQPGLHASWHAVGSVTVWAGTFHDCFRRDEPEATAPTWVIYCRGVGHVKYYVESEGWQAELIQKNF